MNTRALVLAGAAVLLTGCFDGHYDIALNSDGGGRIAVDIVLDKDLSRDILKENKGKLKMEGRHSSLGRTSRTSQRVENGSIVASESLDFAALSEITGGGVDLEVRKLGRTMLGATRSQVRFATSANPAKQPGKNDSSDAFGKQLLNQMFKGHEMRVTMHLPCVVESASSITADGTTYAPKIETSWLHGSTVEWRLPMPAALATDARGPHDFIATCWSYAGIAPGRSQSK